MTKNVGRTDKIIRIVAGIVLLVIGIFVPMPLGTLTTLFQVILSILGAYLLITGIISFCLIYSLLKINTLGK